MKKWDIIEVKRESPFYKELAGERFVAEYKELPHFDCFGYDFEFNKVRFFLTVPEVNILERNIMKFETIKEVEAYFNEYRVNNAGAKNINYSVTAKKALVEFMQRHQISNSICANAAGVSTFSIGHWKNQYRQGLYDNLDAVTKVSMKTKESHSSAVEHLKELKEKLKKEYEHEITNIDIQIRTIKHLEEKGYKVTKAA